MSAQQVLITGIGKDTSVNIDKWEVLVNVKACTEFMNRHTGGIH